MKRILLYTFLICTHLNNSYGQDIIGGEATYLFVGNNSYEFNFYLYTQTSMGINHPIISSSLGNLLGSDINQLNDITEWHYTLTYTYSGNGVYHVTATDSFRIASIQNIINSETTSLTFELPIIINPFIGTNTSPVFVNKQTDVTINGNNYVHSAAAFDPDGDSLSYSIVPCSAPNYSFPPGATIDSSSGLFQMPITSGIYAINIKVEEWRTGAVIGNTFRGMLIDSGIISGFSTQSIKNLYDIYPNPFTSYICITQHNQSMGISKYSVKNILGQTIINSNGRDISADSVNKIDLSFLEKGIYFIELIIDGNRVVDRIVKD